MSVSRTRTETGYAVMASGPSPYMIGAVVCDGRRDWHSWCALCRDLPTVCSGMHSRDGALEQLSEHVAVEHRP